jgi:enoyl-[acyl-carrier protein] reductase II
MASMVPTPRGRGRDADDALPTDPAPSEASLAAIDRLMARGAAFFGARYALMGGAMSWVSERNLVAALSNAGAFGVIANGAMEPPRLAEEIAGTQALTSRPFGVNLITMHPRLDQLVQTCLDHRVGHIVFAGGIPPGPRSRRRRMAARRWSASRRRSRWPRSSCAPAPMRW